MSKCWLLIINQNTLNPFLCSWIFLDRSIPLREQLSEMRWMHYSDNFQRQREEPRKIQQNFSLAVTWAANTQFLPPNGGGFFIRLGNAVRLLSKLLVICTKWKFFKEEQSSVLCCCQRVLFSAFLTLFGDTDREIKKKHMNLCAVR